MTGLIDVLLGAEPDRRLFLRDGAWVSAADVRDMAARAAARMAGGPERIFLHTTCASRFVAGLLAGAATGKTIVLPAHAQSAYLEEIGCGAAALIDDAWIDAPSMARAELGGAMRDPLLVFFTSGSTGTPKAVEKNLSRVETECRALDALWGADAGHVIATVSHQHIYGLLFRVGWPLLSGRTADDAPATYWEDLDGRFENATLISSPAHLTRLPPRADFFAPAPRLVFSSGQLLGFDAAQACTRAFGAPVIEVLGSTETGGIGWRKQTTRDAAWTPFPSIAISQNDDGAMLVRSPYLQSDAPHQTGDGVAIEADGTFRLEARQDRVAKIDGKRVSLPRVEEALAALPEIASAAAFDLPSRNGALAAITVLTAEGHAALERLGAFRLSRTLRIAAGETLEPAERPKHWRFVDAIPTDSQGKRTLASLRALFEARDVLEPIDLDMRALSDSEAEIAFTLPRELIFFDGHFPDRPILPGVAQAHIAVLMAQRLWSTWPSDANLQRVKFRRVLVPGDAVVLKLKHDPRVGRVSFSWHLDDVVVSQGDIGGAKR